MLGPEGLTEKQTAFSDPEAVMAWAQAHRGGATADRVRRLAARLVRTDGVEPVGEAPSPGRPARYSTAELVAIEIATRLHWSSKAARPSAPSIEPRTPRSDRAGRRDRPLRRAGGDGPRGGHEREPRHLRRRPRGCRQDDRHPRGRPGLRARRASRSSEQRRRASRPRSSRTRPASARQRFTASSTKPATAMAWPAVRCSWSTRPAMAETRVLAPVLDLVEQAGGKAILIGDPHQLPAVGAGGLFAGIVEREGAVVLTENRRQRDELEREVLARVRAGVGRDYLAYAEKRERLVVSESPVTTRARLLADWWEQARDDLTGNVMLALRRADVADLNQLGRALMDTDGRLGKERLVSCGPRVRRRGPHRLSPQLRRSRGQERHPRQPSEQVDLERRTLAIDTDRGPSVELSRALSRGGQRPARLRDHRPRSAGPHGPTRIRPRLRRSPPTGMGLRRSLPRTHRNPPLRHRHPARAREPLPRPRRPRSARPLRPRARRVGGRGARSRPEATAFRAAARSATGDRAHAASAPEGLLQRRLLEQKKLALTKMRDGAQRRLEDAERRLERSGTFRRRERAELRAELKLQRHAIAVAEQQLVETIESIGQLSTATRVAVRANGSPGGANPRPRARDDALKTREVAGDLDPGELTDAPRTDRKHDVNALEPERSRDPPLTGPPVQPKLPVWQTTSLRGFAKCEGDQVVPLITMDTGVLRVQAGPGTGKTFGLRKRVLGCCIPAGTLSIRRRSWSARSTE